MVEGSSPARGLGRATSLALGIVAAAIAVRFATLAVLGMDPLQIHRVASGPGLAWDWGYEQAAVAQSIARGDGFSDPFPYETGPTAWVAPVYPLLLGGLIHLFGGITPAVAWCLVTLQILAASATCWFLFRLGRALHSPAVGLAGAGLWAIHPMAVHLPVQLVWDSTLVAMGVTWLLASMAERGSRPGKGGLVALGAGLGLTALVNPAPLALVPLVVVFFMRPASGERGVATGGIGRAAVVLVVAALVSSPWWIRNAVVLGTPQIRSNLGVELFVGNNHGATGPFNGHLHPAYNESERTLLVELGEVPYSKDARGRALRWISEHPSRFATLTLLRAQRFWIGPDPSKAIVLGSGETSRRDWMGWVKWSSHALIGLLALLGLLLWSGRVGSRLLLGGTIALFPLVYYVTHVVERYRFPIEPIATLLAAYAVLRFLVGRRRLASWLP
ncbi:MAG: hypothetical protein VX015_08660 [Planctomycetota bacterium]|nr:hypothetical protein [Planctomycetota bacterium]